jgi:alpha/beta hydrolase family protein
MPVCSVDSLTVAPYEDGAAFGDTGAYEVVRGIVRYAVDPDAPASRRVVDLDRAPRDPDGLVRFDSDLVVLRPADPLAGNRGLLYSVANRGAAGSVPLSAGAFSIPGASDRIVPGDAFPLRRGYAVAWSGWQWDVLRGQGMVGLAAPTACGDDGAPIAGPVRVQVLAPASGPRLRLASLALDPDRAPPLPLPPAVLDDSGATLTVRDRPGDGGTVIARDAWRFVDAEHLELDDGFEAGRFYEVVFRTARCPVVGAGFLAVRDAVAWLRHAPVSDGNPLAGRVDFAIATGASQSGRFLRHFLFEGMNVDDEGRAVFDGVHVHIAGGRRGEFNVRYGQPGVMWHGVGDEPPFTTNAHVERQRAVGGVPKVIATNSAAEYWRGDAWFAHGDADTGRDVDDLPEVRHYLLAGVDHLGEIGSFVAAMVPAANRPNGLSAVAPERAIVVALEQWVRDGTPPPPSLVPRVDDGTAVERAPVLASLREHRDACVPDADALPPGRGGAPGLVAAVDDDGNERAGVRLPQLTVPVAAYAGWNVRPSLDGLPALMPDFLGSRFPLPVVEIGRRYPDRADYETRVRTAAAALVEQRLLLDEDVAMVVDAALTAYDESIAGI